MSPVDRKSDVGFYGWCVMVLGLGLWAWYFLAMFGIVHLSPEKQPTLGGLTVIALAIGGYMIAIWKGHAGWKGALLVPFLSILGLAILLLWPNRRAEVADKVDEFE